MVGGEEWLENVGKKAAAAYERKGEKSPYATFRENGMAILKSNATYLSAGPVVAMVWAVSYTHLMRGFRSWDRSRSLFFVVDGMDVCFSFSHYCREHDLSLIHI